MTVAMPIDRSRGARVVFTCSHELRAEIEAWRGEQRPIPSESAAIAALLWRALQQWREQQAEAPKPPRKRS
jgi:hypothetical protein